MPATRKRFQFLLMILGAATLLLGSQAFATRTYTVIATFNNANGAEPMDGLVWDQAGNLYGTTSAGGLGKGVVFELSPNGSGGWTETVLYQFGSHGGDGATPFGWLIFDSTGNLYGTTQHGGTKGVGTVFELSPAGGGAWTETVIHSFGSVPKDGEVPIAGVAIDSAGNLYGTTFSGGNASGCMFENKTTTCGTVYELSPAAGGTWTYNIIHNFSTLNQDGNLPVAGVTVASDGSLFVEAAYGSKYHQGLLLKLIPGQNNTWTEQGLHPWGFVHDGRPDGGFPYSTMVFDSAGFMYGTSNIGGTHGDLGTVFKFTAASNGGWVETSLHGFGNPPQGSYPYSSLLVDPLGDLYGSTNKGGTLGFGTIYELLPTPIGYEYKPIYNFTGLTDGGLPVSNLVMDSAGNLYGTTPYGGDPTVCTTAPIKGCGVVYKISAQ